MEKDKRIIWLEERRKAQVNSFEKRVEELKKAGVKVDEAVISKYRLEEVR